LTRPFQTSSLSVRTRPLTRRPAPQVFLRFVVVFTAILASPAARADAAPTQPGQPGHWREASLADYRQHLKDLSAIVDACAKARDTKTCDPMLVGEDDRVLLSGAPNAERRLVRYGWLRMLLSDAQEPDQPQDKPQDKSPAKPASPSAQPPPVESPVRVPQPTTSQRLQDAKARFVQDLAQADAAAAASSPVSHAPERETMKQVLAGRDFRGLQEPMARDSALERFGAWLNRILEGLQRIHAHSAWLGRVAVWGFILIVCVGLVWGLLQLERRWRIRLVPEIDSPRTGAASERDWRLYVEDARLAAAAGEWRQAIHFVYWASISRLESKRLWPADRARTPREYLSLVASDDPRKAGLARLTGSFERTWYGGRAAAEGDYLRAERLAEELISSNAATAAGTSQGGAR
jgi:hypothetical protein